MTACVQQEVIRAAPYYLLNGNTQTADILYANTSSYVPTHAGATAAFHSMNTSNQANITLLVCLHRQAVHV